ncbi:hypothetical protein CKQ53_01130 [Lonsdalea britannica]|uniref:Uncharacterized protein n=1 Tax=Lonsdalea britannica TaxID=1082704 RepID=A0AAD0SE30_9GAMM|nr:hypothetical protein CKQ53_01130 [Lonsdalea britannica]OSN03852.1 hypothetical protein AU510_13410 [Lonsdalea britannica]
MEFMSPWKTGGRKTYRLAVITKIASCLISTRLNISNNYEWDDEQSSSGFTFSWPMTDNGEKMKGPDSL